jgi:DNA polymerase-3 subunit epsilon/oligoribonuclease
MLAIFLDIETTGLDCIKHHVIDIAFSIVDVTNEEIKNSFQSLVKVSPEIWANCDPVSLQINGYAWDQVCAGKDPKTVGQEIIDIFKEQKIERGKAIFICQNPGFDRGFFNQLVDVYTQERLGWPYHWLDFASMHWANVMVRHQKNGTKMPERMSLSKNSIAEEYLLLPEQDPHRAKQGVEHLILCYETVFGVQFKKG